MSFLLDTNVISEIRKPAPNASVKAWIDSVNGAELFLSVLVVGEIRQGVERLRRRDAARAIVYERWLETLHDAYADRILPITAEIAEEWGRINAVSPVPVIDGLEAATAKVMQMTLVTRNTSDVARTGAALLNPF